MTWHIRMYVIEFLNARTLLQLHCQQRYVPCLTLCMVQFIKSLASLESPLVELGVTAGIRKEMKVQVWIRLGAIRYVGPWCMWQ